MTEENQPGTQAADDFEVTNSVAVTEEPKKPAVEDDSENIIDQDKAKKPTNGYKKTIEKLKAENESLKRMQSGQQPPQQSTPAKPAVVDDGKPKVTDFQTHEAFVEALTDWKAKAIVGDEFKKREDAVQKTEAQKKHQEKIDSFEKQKEAAKEVHPDFDEVLSQFDDIPVNPAIHGAMLDSDKGAEIAYYLASNPEEFEKLNSRGMGILEVNRAIAKIEARLENSVIEKVEPVIKVKTTSRAPEPIEPVGKAKSAGVFDPNTADPDDYIKWRWKQLKQ